MIATLMVICLATGPGNRDKICDGMELRAGSVAECREQIAAMRALLAGSPRWVLWQECRRAN